MATRDADGLTSSEICWYECLQDLDEAADPGPDRARLRVKPHNTHPRPLGLATRPSQNPRPQITYRPFAMRATLGILQFRVPTRTSGMSWMLRRILVRTLRTTRPLASESTATQLWDDRGARRRLSCLCSRAWE